MLEALQNSFARINRGGGLPTCNDNLEGGMAIMVGLQPGGKGGGKKRPKTVVDLSGFF